MEGVGKNVSEIDENLQSAEIAATLRPRSTESTTARNAEEASAACAAYTYTYVEKEVEEAASKATAEEASTDES